MNKVLRIAVIVAVASFAVAAPAASAAPVALELCATTGSVTLTGEPAAIPIWGFGVPATPGDCSTATPSLPGPPLTLAQGDTATLTLHNDLPAGTLSHALRFEIPGITLDPGPVTAAVGDTVTVTFTAAAAGTYQYQSSGDAGRQEAMGLTGALVVAPPTPGPYDLEALLVLSTVDPAFNNAPDTFDLHGYRATSWLVNGQPYPNAGITAGPGQRVLLRYVNTGYDNTSLVLLGMHLRVVARDARPLSAPLLAVAETIPAGGTEDAIVTVPTSAPPGPNGFPIYNRQLHLTSGPQTGPTPAPGGMLTFIHP